MLLSCMPRTLNLLSFAVVDKSGCAEHHYNMWKCVRTYGDWVKCQDLVKVFKDCIVKETKRRGETYSDFYVDFGTSGAGR